MSNIFFGLNIGRSALLANQTALDVTGHNLANVETEGYSRQRVSMVQSLPIPTPQGPVGSGVSMDRIQRLQLGYVERQVTKVKTQHSSDQTLVTGLDDLQALLGEPADDGINAAMTEFWNSWEALSASPSDAGLRAQVLDRSEHLATVYNQKIDGLVDVEARFEDNLASDVGEVNAWTKQLATLNGSIAKAEATGYTANDLRDQRDVVIRQISEKLGVEVEPDGPYLDLKLAAGGPYLTHRTDSFDVVPEPDASGRISGFHVGASPLTPSGGEMGALLELRDDVSPGLRGDLSRLMATVADRVNNLHTSGYDRDGVPGRNLFLWKGEATTTAFLPSAGLRSVSVETPLEPGTHSLAVKQVDPGLVSNQNGTIPAAVPPWIDLTAVASGPYSGPLAINLDYHVRVVSPNADPSSLDGLRVQLFRGDEAVGAVQTLGGAGPANARWNGVDGFDFSADISSGRVFAASERADGLSTTGTVSLDGGAAKPVNLQAGNNIEFFGGGGQGYVAGGSLKVNFSGEPFTGASVTLYSPSDKLEVDPSVAADADKIVAGVPAQGGGPGASGDGEMARRVADLATQGIFEDIGETPAGYLGRTVQSLGSKARDARVFEKASNSVLLQLETQRQGASGVNVDEEMVQLMQYQRGFEAAARFLTTIDGLVDTLINRVGLAGR